MKKTAVKILLALLLAVTMLFCSCSENIATREAFAMDTYILMKAQGTDAEKALDKALAAIEDFDKNFSVSAVAGEIETLLRTGELADPSKALVDMLTCAKTLYERTDGAYDVTAYALSQVWGFYSENRVPSEEEIAEALALVGMDKIEFDETKICLNGVKGIDLGSIAKGCSGNAALEAMKGLEVDHSVITLGGNVVTYGEKEDGEKFKIGVTDPNAPNTTCGYLSIGEAHVVTSGKYNRNFTVGEKTYHHIIDARTGYPCENGLAQVTVICSDGMWADALSTALFLLGEQGALDYYSTYGGFEAVLVTDDGRIILTDGAKAMFTGV